MLTAALQPRPGTVGRTRTTAYKTAGMALFDLFVARAVYEAARRHNLGCEVTLVSVPRPGQPTRRLAP